MFATAANVVVISLEDHKLRLRMKTKKRVKLA
jgi:hypothetical protein